MQGGKGVMYTAVSCCSQPDFCQNLFCLAVLSILQFLLAHAFADSCYWQLLQVGLTPDTLTHSVQAVSYSRSLCDTALGQSKWLPRLGMFSATASIAQEVIPDGVTISEQTTQRLY